MTVPGVGPVVALTYSAAVDVTSPFSQVEVCRGCLWLATFTAPIRR